MSLRLTTADENAPDSEQLIPPSHSRAKRIFVGMAVSALTQVRLCPTLHGRDARATKVYFQERHRENLIAVSPWLCGCSSLRCAPHTRGKCGTLPSCSFSRRP